MDVNCYSIEALSPDLGSPTPFTHQIPSLSARCLFFAALSQCKDQTPLLVFKMAAALAQADKQHKTACKAAGVDHQELSSACYRMVFGHQGSTTTTAPGLGHQAYQPPSTVGSSAVRSFDVEVRKELVKAKVDLTADSDKLGADYTLIQWHLCQRATTKS